MAFDHQSAKDFIARTDLPSQPELFGINAGMGMPDFETSSQQSLVVGSNVVSFASGIDAKLRQAITDTSLFAQLAAARAVNNDPDPLKFFDAYFTYLANIGWVIQSKQTAEVNYEGDTLEVHKAILGVITSFLSPVAGALQAVLSVLSGLQNMNRNAPFITLFKKQSQHGNIGRFQFTCIYSDPEQGPVARAIAFSLQADNTLTQVLFFKLQKGKTNFRRSEGVLSIDAHALISLQSQLTTKLKAYHSAYIADTKLAPLEED
ncbi:hypothetical protein [Leclercia sp.]|uniref:hypothetical protein n=1 Tax=Leclercia sp. TaxID=1898428 RepID=UPI002FDCD2A0